MIIIPLAPHASMTVVPPSEAQATKLIRPPLPPLPAPQTSAASAPVMATDPKSTGSRPNRPAESNPSAANR